jgi:hypothetical protein
MQKYNVAVVSGHTLAIPLTSQSNYKLPIHLDSNSLSAINEFSIHIFLTDTSPQTINQNILYKY